ncbi:MAG: ABC transporter ATP-binding protein [Spirochaetia bacterium]|nr:ABC transporter ATP-binding protein [Spirochaetia bacterium]MCF7942512.1 ABC transporter ATP-binding protein [Spirochaetia bacterium]
MSFIELTNIDAGYEKGKPILKDFHVSVEQGELVSLLGPSGCGKTTTLRTIAGFIMAEKGKVVIGGRDYSNVPPNKRNIGLVFQNYALFPHLSVYDNVAYGLRRRKVAKELIPEKIANVLKLVSLTGYEKRLPSELSGGQRQRVALARSIVIEPDLLLLDEPLSNLDAKLRDEMRAELSRLQHQLGITMIYVTHDQVEALSLSSRIIVMNEGNIEQMGTPEDIYERPATPFVANFVGFDNSLTGTVRAVQKHRVTVEVNGSSFVSTRVTQVAGGLSPGDQVALFFRPDDTSLTDEAGENTIAGEILYVNYQGNTSSYALKVDQESIRAVMPGRPMSGDTREIRMRIDPEKLIIERV